MGAMFKVVEIEGLELVVLSGWSAPNGRNNFACIVIMFSFAQLGHSSKKMSEKFEQHET